MRTCLILEFTDGNITALSRDKIVAINITSTYELSSKVPDELTFGDGRKSAPVIDTVEVTVRRISITDILGNVSEGNVESEDALRVMNWFGGGENEVSPGKSRIKILSESYT